MKEKLVQIEVYIKRMDKQAKWILVIAIILIFVAPFILTRSLNLISFSQTGPIGDTIGGTTAPIIGLLSALLIYISFKAQINANKIQMDALVDERNRIDEEKERIDNENEIKFIDSLLNELHKSDNDLKFKEAINSVYKKFEDIKNSYVKKQINEEGINQYFKDQITLVYFYKYINLLFVIKNKIEKTKFKDDIQKDYIKASYKYRYLLDFSWYINYIIETYNDLLRSDQKIPEEIIKLVEIKCMPIKEYMKNLDIK